MNVANRRVFVANNHPLQGTSGGSLGSLIACSGIEHEFALEFIIQLSKSADFKRDIDAGLKKELRTILSAQENILERCNGRLHVVTTKLSLLSTMKPYIISEYDSLDTLIDSVAASCFIPGYSSMRVGTAIHGHSGQFVDGGVFAFMPPIGDVRVSPFPKQYASILGGQIDICLPIDE